MKTKISEIYAKNTWAYMIKSIEKYYPNSLVNSELGIYEIIISPKKNWVFDVLNRVFVNRDYKDERIETCHPFFSAGRCSRYGYATDDVCYSIAVKPYCNGNMHCMIKTK